MWRSSTWSSRRKDRGRRNTRRKKPGQKPRPWRPGNLAWSYVYIPNYIYVYIDHSEQKHSLYRSVNVQKQMFWSMILIPKNEQNTFMHFQQHGAWLYQFQVVRIHVALCRHLRSRASLTMLSQASSLWNKGLRLKLQDRRTILWRLKWKRQEWYRLHSSIWSNKMV